MRCDQELYLIFYICIEDTIIVSISLVITMSREANIS